MILKKAVIILIHAIIGWSLCEAVIAFGKSFTSIGIVMIMQAIAIPVIFLIISFIYFTKFNFTSPFKTAFIFLHFAVFMDIFVVAAMIEKNYKVFKSPIGTLIPLTLIFVTTFVVGVYFRNRNKTIKARSSIS